MNSILLHWTCCICSYWTLLPFLSMKLLTILNLWTPPPCCNFFSFSIFELLSHLSQVIFYNRTLLPFWIFGLYWHLPLWKLLFVGLHESCDHVFWLILLSCCHIEPCCHVVSSNLPGLLSLWFDSICLIELCCHLNLLQFVFFLKLATIFWI